MADDGPQRNFQDGSEDNGLSANLDRPKRTAPTLDLDAVEVSDKASQPEATEERLEPARRPAADAMLAGIISTVFGGSAAALVIAAAWWTGWLAQKVPALPTALPVHTVAIDALAARIARVEAAVNTPPAPAPAPAVPAPDPTVVTRLDTTEKSLELIRAELAASRAQSDQLATAVNDIKSLPREIPPPPPAAAPPTDLSPVNERIAQLERATKALSVEAKPNAPPADDVPLRRVVAAALLDISVRQGEPYAAVLAAARPFALNADTLKPLEPFATSGVPSANALNRELLAIVSKLSSPAQASAPESIVDRLQAGAAKLVRIERTDAAIGNDRNAIVARVTAAALRNDLGEARRELNTLAPADRAAAQSWIDRANARDAALAASREFAVDGLASLTKPAP